MLADRLGQLVDPVYDDPAGWGGLAPVLATYAYAFQIYFDFSGYTDMARAAARLLGVELTENFRAPYLAGSPAEFWRRWHISFSRWLLDYLFTPLQLAWRRLGARGTALALLVTFTASGLWHGLNLGFLAWGLLHGLLLAAESLWRAGPGRRRRATPGHAPGPLAVVTTFHAVALAWVFFRAGSLAVALGVLAAVGREGPGLWELLGRNGLRASLVTVACLTAYGLVQRAVVPRLARPGAFAPWARWLAGAAVYAAILLLRVEASGFIYLQF